MKGRKKEEYSPLIGLEIEFHLIDKQGNIKNNADCLINDKESSGYLFKELTHSMIEVICPPSNDISILAKNMKKELDNAVYLAQKHNVALVPSTTIGKCNPKKRKKPRYTKKEIILGKERREMEYHICGTHVHIDKADDIVKQHTLITGLDPVFSLMSGSPFFKSVNHLKDYRVEMYRNVIFEKFPLNGALLPYVKNEDELEKRLTDSYNVWMKQCKIHGVDQEGFSRLNTCWGPVRFSEKTIESRSCDTNLFSKVMALAAFYAGLNRQLDNQDVELPDYKALKYFENQGIRVGLENDQLKGYLSGLLKIAEQGLEEKEIEYLEPFKKSLRDKKNFSDEITDFAYKQKLYDGVVIPKESAREIRNYISECFIKDLNIY